MFEKRYERAASAIHPPEALVRRTLEKIAADDRHPALIPAGLRRIAAFVAALVLVVFAVRLALPQDDVTHPASSTPLSRPPEAAGYVFTPGTPYLDEEGRLVTPFSVTGAGVNAYTQILLRDTTVLFPHPHPNATRFAPETQPDYGKDYAADPTLDAQFQLSRDDGFTPENTELTFTFNLERITLCSDHRWVIHDTFDLSAQPLTIEQRKALILNPTQYYYFLDTPDPDHRAMTYFLTPGEPLLDLGRGAAITAIGYNHQHNLVVQARVPADWLTGSYYFEMLETDTGGETEWLFASETRVWHDDALQYAYIESVYDDVTKENVADYRLNTIVHPVDQIIEGPWTLTFDLTRLNFPD